MNSLLLTLVVIALLGLMLAVRRTIYTAGFGPRPAPRSHPDQVARSQHERLQDLLR